MTTTRFLPRNLQGLPTLTEVIELPVSQGTVEAAPEPEQAGDSAAQHAGVSFADATASPDLDEEQIVEGVLTELQRHAELMLEFRLREAIEPALARAADTLVRELRAELAATLRDVVARSVSQEIARQRGR